MRDCEGEGELRWEAEYGKGQRWPSMPCKKTRSLALTLNWQHRSLIVSDQCCQPALQPCSQVPKPSFSSLARVSICSWE